MQKIFDLEILNEREWVKTNLSFKTAKRAMETARKGAIPTCPATLEELIDNFLSNRYANLYQEMFEAVVSKIFTIPDGGTVMKHAIILVNRAILEDVFRTCTVFNMDGTFKTTPKLGNSFDDRASQVLLITADYHGSPVVIFAVVMQSRKEVLYTKVFEHIHDHYVDFRPVQVMSDFEKAMRSGFKNVFKEARLLGCR